MTRLLVTGFERFPGVPVNISEQLVRGWRQQPPTWPFTEMRFEVLPTCYAAAGEAVERLLADYSPDFHLLFGVAGTPTTLRLERIALNIDDGPVPDASGDFRQGASIDAGGPLALATQVDIARLKQALVDAEVQVEISNHAGAYVCNHSYYTALSAAQRSNGRTQVLFVHIPSGPMEDDAASEQERQSLALAVSRGADVLVRAIASLGRP